MNQFIEDHKEELITFAKEHGIQYLALFGSQARGDHRSDSDIDMLVEFSDPVGLMEHARVGQALELLLGRKVDLISRKFLKPTFRQYIQDDLVEIL